MTTITIGPRATTAPQAGPGRPARDQLPVSQAVPGQPAVQGAKTVRSWPLLVLAAPAAAEVWSGWVGIAQKTGFGQVSPLPGIWPSLHLDTAITLPVGVEAYAAYALRAWLARDHPVSSQTRRFAKWPAIGSLALGMAGQVAYHLLAQAGAARAPWPVTTIVSCLPVLVLAMGTTLAHMLRADATAPGPAVAPTPRDWSAQDQPGDHPDQSTRSGPPPGSGPPTTPPQDQDRHASPETRRASAPIPEAKVDQALLVALKLAGTGMPLSRRTLRSGGVSGSNEALNALARAVNAELANAAAQNLTIRPSSADAERARLPAKDEPAGRATGHQASPAAKLQPKQP